MAKFEYPEEVEQRHMDTMDAVKGIDLLDIQKLAEAWREGRVVIMPFKPGTKFAQSDDPNHEFDMTFTGDVQFQINAGEECEYFSAEDLTHFTDEFPIIEDTTSGAGERAE